MLQTVLSPLRSRFDLSSKTSTTAARFLEEQEQAPSPEQFARDVLTVENIKRADSDRAKYEVLWKLQGMAVTDDCHRFWLRYSG